MTNDLSSIEQLISDELRAQVGATEPPLDAWDRFVEYIEEPGTRMFDVDSGEWEPHEGPDDDLVFEFLVHHNETEPLARQKWRSSVVLAVTAAVLVVVGVVIVADRNSGDERIETVSSPTVTDPPVASPGVADPVPLPGVIDSLGYLWSRVPHDEAVFGGADLNSVTVGGPGLVAVGSDGTGGAVVTSIDGLTWSRVPHDEAVFGGASLFTVTTGGPGLVAIGKTSIDVDGGDGSWLWTSVDGLTWTRHEGVFDGSGPNDVTAGGPGLVAVGEDDRGAAVWTSIDGLTWSRVPHDEAVFGHTVGDGNGMTGVTVGGPGLVAVGSDGLNSDSPTGRAHAVVWTSVDGLTWLRVPHDEAVFGGPGDQGMFDITVGGPGLVAVGENDQGAPVWTSVDGITWSRVPDDEAVFNADTRIFNLIATNAGLVAVGESDVGWWPDAEIWTSLDGITWARVDAPVLGREGVTDVTLGGPGLVAVGGWPSSNAAIWVARWRTDDHPINWEEQP